MFVNLARRSQILVDRLIGHLDRLERGEQDPDRLSELFQLDHLATRMRRNDENLLVLAGADSTRIQREPAALMDVLRAAQSEVEHYTRVEFSIVDHDIEIAAHAVNDLVHLVAELFDNATAFSPPDTPIRVEARRIGERAVLRVEDRASACRRISTPSSTNGSRRRRWWTSQSPDDGPGRGRRLAARHGVKVELQPSPDRGPWPTCSCPAASWYLARWPVTPTCHPASQRCGRAPARLRWIPAHARRSDRRWRWRAVPPDEPAAGTTAAVAQAQAR
jgi:signal transduction histidine kinase